MTLGAFFPSISKLKNKKKSEVFPNKLEIKSEWVKGIMAGVILAAFIFIPYFFKLGYMVMFAPVRIFFR